MTWWCREAKCADDLSEQGFHRRLKKFQLAGTYRLASPIQVHWCAACRKGVLSTTHQHILMKGLHTHLFSVPLFHNSCGSGSLEIEGPAAIICETTFKLHNIEPICPDRAPHARVHPHHVKVVADFFLDWSVSMNPYHTSAPASNVSASPLNDSNPFLTQRSWLAGAVCLM